MSVHRLLQETRGGIPSTSEWPTQKWLLWIRQTEVPRTFIRPFDASHFSVQRQWNHKKERKIFITHIHSLHIKFVSNSLYFLSIIKHRRPSVRHPAWVCLSKLARDDVSTVNHSHIAALFGGRLKWHPGLLGTSCTGQVISDSFQVGLMRLDSQSAVNACVKVVFQDLVSGPCLRQEMTHGGPASTRLQEWSKVLGNLISWGKVWWFWAWWRFRNHNAVNNVHRASRDTPPG